MAFETLNPGQMGHRSEVWQSPWDFLFLVTIVMPRPVRLEAIPTFHEDLDQPVARNERGPTTDSLGSYTMQPPDRAFLKDCRAFLCRLIFTGKIVTIEA